MEKTPLVTNVVIAYNNADTIQPCLESVLGQDYLRMQTIVVSDKGSTDGTDDRIRELLTKTPGRFETLSIPHLGRSAARNFGWRHGDGEVVFFADGDDVYNSNYLSRAIGAIGGEKTGCVCVTGASLVEGDGLASRMLRVYSLVQVQRRKKSGFRPSWAWVYTRRALEEANGYDERLSQAEDKDLFERVQGLGYKAAVVDGINWSHRRASSTRAYFRKSLLGGVRRVPYLAKHRSFGGFMRATAIVWILALAFALQFFFEWSLLVAFFGVLAFLTFRGLDTAALVWREVPHKTDLVLYPFFNLATHAVSALGVVAGLFADLRQPRPQERIT